MTRVANVTPELPPLGVNVRWESISRTLAEQPEGLLVWSPSRASQSSPARPLPRPPPVPARSIPSRSPLHSVPLPGTHTLVRNPARVLHVHGEEANGRVCTYTCGRWRDGSVGILTISSMAGPLDKATPWGNKYPAAKAVAPTRVSGVRPESGFRGRIYARTALKRGVRPPPSDKIRDKWRPFFLPLFLSQKIICCARGKQSLSLSVNISRPADRK